VENVSAAEEGRQGETARIRFIKGKGVNERSRFDKSEGEKVEIDTVTRPYRC